jgi:serine/threonine protein kinase
MKARFVLFPGILLQSCQDKKSSGDQNVVGPTTAGSLTTVAPQVMEEDFPSVSTVVTSTSFRPQEEFDNRYDSLEEIGRGASGHVFKARRKSDGLQVAIKMNFDIPKGEREAMALRAVSHLEKFPRLMESASDGQSHFIVQTRLGLTVMEMERLRGPFSVPTIGSIALQMLERIEELHSVGYVHLDLYPNNVAFELPDTKNIYLIDFGEALKLSNSPIKTRRFDLRSLSHSVLRLLIPNTIYGDYNHYVDAKISLEDMCATLPDAILRLFKYTHETLGNDDEPDYQYIQSLLLELNPNYHGTIELS